MDYLEYVKQELENEWLQSYDKVRVSTIQSKWVEYGESFQQPVFSTTKTDKSFPMADITVEVTTDAGLADKTKNVWSTVKFLSNNGAYPFEIRVDGERYTTHSLEISMWGQVELEALKQCLIFAAQTLEAIEQLNASEYYQAKMRAGKAKQNKDVVYAILFDNDVVKIGLTQDISRRFLELSGAANVIDGYYTNQTFSRKLVRLIEHTLHKQFESKRKYPNGSPEYFINLSLEEACAALREYSELTRLEMTK